MNDTAMLLKKADLGKPLGSADLLPLVYGELRRLATARLAREANMHTLQPTALVHETWLRLSRGENDAWKNNAHFFAAAARAMQRILIENARRRVRLKHGGGLERFDIDDFPQAGPTPDEKVLLIDEALKELEAEHPQRARVVVLRFFGGLTNREIAEALDIGERTVDRHWVCAKSWLFRKIQSRM